MIDALIKRVSVTYKCYETLTSDSADRGRSIIQVRFFSDARTFHNIYKLQKHVLLRHQSYLIVFTVNKILRFGR
jgi:hypothetical protein